ncbi:MAG: hypothetical protein KJ666_04575, partial [Bacteroidetes bacterium]|nr:hypothetical protein [Bacteroidota bacterium]
NIAKDFPRGYFPRYFYEEKSYWTVIGVSSDVKEALINEDGMVEVDKERLSIEPMLSIDNKLITWNEADKKQSLEKNYLPIPNVVWDVNGLNLEIKAFAAGEANKNSVLYLMYKLSNKSNEKLEGRLFLLIRPYQVNPYYQELNLTGGASKIYSINISDDLMQIDNDKFIYSLTPYNSAGAMRFEEGNIVSSLAKGISPSSPIGVHSQKNIEDQLKLASGVFAYDFDLQQNDSKLVLLAVPFYGNELGQPIFKDENSNINLVEDLLFRTIKFWDDKVSQIKFNLPKSADKIINTYKSNLAYILINRDKSGIQPGSRSYERSWIRDGSLTSSALLKSGIVDEVREFIDWYSEYQYENGKIPCVVDTRGPDPVPEHDSHGEYIFLLKQFYNFTKDTSVLSKHNTQVNKTIDYIHSLINQRSTDHFKNGNDSVRAYYGIMPESISHEGYSAKPMHSYWDNFFTIRGLKDAVDIQLILGDQNSYEKIKLIRDKFKTDLYNSLNLAIKTRNIDYIPGCVELGDFDPTSTTIALYPCNEYPNLPQPYLKNTFDKYYQFFQDRRDGKLDWVNYTPYEVRTIGSFIFLDQPEIAHKLIDFFLKDQRPTGWNHWAEVVWKEYRKPAFIGDMPHTWVGSDFINAVRAMFVYENDYDTSLVIGAGLYQSAEGGWIDSPGGMSIENLPTYFGELSYLIKKREDHYELRVFGDLEIPSGKIILKNFNSSKVPKKVIINGIVSENFSNKQIIINQFPAKVEIYY